MNFQGRGHSSPQDNSPAHLNSSRHRLNQDEKELPDEKEDKKNIQKNVSGLESLHESFLRDLDLDENPEARSPSKYNGLADIMYQKPQGDPRHKEEEISGVGGIKLFVDVSKNVDQLLNFNKVTDSPIMHRLKIDYDTFTHTNIWDDPAEYEYQSWNHFANMKNLKLNRNQKKTKKKVVDEDDFSALEKKSLKVIEKLPSTQLVREVCLNYQYSPDYCFNSMVDVIDIGIRGVHLNSIEETEEVPTTRQVYTSRAFSKHHDSIYTPLEFPIEPEQPLKRKGKKTHSSVFKTMSNMSNHSLKKQEIYEQTHFLQTKAFLPIRNKPDIHQRLHEQRSMLRKSWKKFFRVKDMATRFKTGIKKMLQSSAHVADTFLDDFVEIDAKHMIEKEELAELEPEDLFEGITEKEKPKKYIQTLNWSGEQILPKTVYRRGKTKKVLKALNKQDTKIWLHGFKGFVEAARKKSYNLMFDKYVEKFYVFCVLGNVFILTMDGLVSSEVSDVFNIINWIFTVFFVIEMILKVFALGVKKYLKNAMNVIDALVVVVSIVEFAIVVSIDEDKSGKASSAFKVLRILRLLKVMRVTRVLNKLSFMKVIVAVVVETAEQYAYVAIILLLFIFIYALVGMQIYAGKLTYDDRLPRLNFDSFIPAFWTLFQLLTFENWTDVVETLYSSTISRWITMIYIISWIVVGNYIFFNLFLALLLGGFDSDNVIKSLEEKKDEFKELLEVVQQETLDRKKEQEELQMKLERQTKAIQFIMKEDDCNEAHAGDEEYIDLLDEEQKKARGTYFVERAKLPGESSMDELFSRTIKEGNEEEARKKIGLLRRKQNIYEGVYCKDALFVFPMDNVVRQFAAKVVSSQWFEPAVIALILISSIKLVAETYLDEGRDETLIDVFGAIDHVITCCFILEALFKILRNGFVLDQNSYLRDPWSCLDLLVVSASTLSMLVPNIDVPMIKILRTLRPLRFVHHYKHMRIIVNSLVGVIGPLISVMLVIIIVWLVFAILAMNIVGGKLGYCDVDDIYGINKSECLAQGNEWKIAYWNFDNIVESFVTLFVLSTLEGWPSIVASSVDAADVVDGAPIYNNNQWMLLYFFLYILLSSLFLLDLLTGVIFYQYQTELNKEISAHCKDCSEDQIRWVMVQKLIFKADSNYNLLEEPKNIIRKYMFKISTSYYFEMFMISIAILNTVLLGMEYEGMSSSYESVLDTINTIFSIVFLIEAIFKIVGMGKVYFKDNWNILDFIIVLISVLDFVSNSSVLSFLGNVRIDSSIAKPLRSIRVVRILKVIKSKQMATLKRLINTLIFSLPTILNVLALLFLVYFIFAVIACYLFKNAVVDQDYSNEVWSFETFHQSMFTIFRCSTGEDWPLVMYNYGDSPGKYTTSRLFFISLTFATGFIMLNLIDLVIVQIFENFYFDPDSPLTCFDEVSEIFNKTWNAFTVKTKGKKIHSFNMPRFFAHLEEPLGFRVKHPDNPPIEQIIKESQKFGIRRPLFYIAVVMAMQDLPIDSEGYIPYSAVLQLALRFMMGNNVLKDSKFVSYSFVKKLESGMLYKRLMNEHKKKSAKRKQLKTASTDLIDPKQVGVNQKKFNCVRVLMNMKTALKTWKEYVTLSEKYKIRNPASIGEEDMIKRISQHRLKEIEFINKMYEDQDDNTSPNASVSPSKARSNLKKHTALIRKIHKLFGSHFQENKEKSSAKNYPRHSAFDFDPPGVVSESMVPSIRDLGLENPIFEEKDNSSVNDSPGSRLSSSPGTPPNEKLKSLTMLHQPSLRRQPISSENTPKPFQFHSNSEQNLLVNPDFEEPKSFMASNKQKQAYKSKLKTRAKEFMKGKPPLNLNNGL